MARAVSIRQQLQPGDIGEIARLHGVVYSEEYQYSIAFEAYVAEGLAEFFHRFDAVRDRVWLCEAANRIVGSLLLMHRDDQAQLRYFLLLPEYRGAGLGKGLMTRYMHALEECDYRHSFLWTTNELPAAASLYKRNGFVLTEEQPSARFGKTLMEQKYEWHAVT